MRALRRRSVLLLFAFLLVACAKKEEPKQLMTAVEITRQLPPPSGWHEVLEGRSADSAYEIAADDGSAAISVATRRMLFGKITPPEDGRLRGILKKYPESVLRRLFQKREGESPDVIAQLVAVQPGRLGGLDALVVRSNYRSRKTAEVRSKLEFAVPGQEGWVIVELSYSRSNEEQEVPRLLGILNGLTLRS